MAIPNPACPEEASDPILVPVIAYMCEADFSADLPMGSIGGIGIYGSPAGCAENRTCVKHCGMVEVIVTFRRRVPREEFNVVEYSTEPWERKEIDSEITDELLW